MSSTHIKEFAELDNRANPDFIEAKGYVYVGHSRENLSMENMPSHDDILSFSNELALRLIEKFSQKADRVVLH